MVPHLRRVVMISLGAFFLVLGVIGGFLPVIQGWIFILIGLALLAEELPWVRRHLDRLKERFPKQTRQLDRLKSRFTPGRKPTGRADGHSGAAPKQPELLP